MGQAYSWLLARVRDNLKYIQKYLIECKVDQKCENFDAFWKCIFYAKVLDIGWMFEITIQSHLMKISSRGRGKTHAVDAPGPIWIILRFWR